MAKVTIQLELEYRMPAEYYDPEHDTLEKRAQFDLDMLDDGSNTWDEYLEHTLKSAKIVQVVSSDGDT